MSFAKYQEGADALSIAVQLDKDGKYEQAMKQYTRGAELMLEGAKVDDLAARKARMKERAREYIARAEQLKQSLQAPVKRAQPADSGVDQNIRARVAQLFEQDLSGTHWRDVAGLESAKAALQEAVVLPRKHPQLFQGKRQPWRTVLLHGPPGTGKTLLAKALAGEAGCTFCAISASDILSKYQGETERTMRAVFEEARSRRPCIIFLDEIDCLGRARVEGEKDSERRMKTELLTQLDGLGSDNKGILFLAATNAPWELDPALRRRFDKRMLVPLPDAYSREQVLRIHLGEEPTTLTPEDLRQLALQTENYSPSDLATVTREALMAPARECLRAKYFHRVRVRDKEGNERKQFAPCSRWTRGAKRMDITDVPSDELYCPPVTCRDFEQALRRIRPTVSQSELRRYEEFAQQFGERSLSAGAAERAVDTTAITAPLGDPLPGQGATSIVEEDASGSVLGAISSLFKPSVRRPASRSKRRALPG